MLGADRIVSEVWEIDERHETLWRTRICEDTLFADALSPPGWRPRARLDIGRSADFLSISIVATRGAGLARTPRRLAVERLAPVYGLSVVTSGHAIVSTPGGERVVRTGELGLLHAKQPFTKRMSADYTEHFLFLPESLVCETLGRSIRCVDIVGRGEGLARVLADSVASFALHKGRLTRPEWRGALRAVIQLAAAIFDPCTDDAELVGASARELQRARVERLIEARLSDPELGPRTVAECLGVSTRYLHKLFERSGRSLSRFILERRLDRCWAQLTAPTHRHANVRQVAFANGFTDASHFSRAFKVRFGMSPREARNSPRERRGTALRADGDGANPFLQSDTSDDIPIGVRQDDDAPHRTVR